MEQIKQFRGNHSAEKAQLAENQQSKGKIHACKASQRGYQQARDRLRRAERDLAETAAFIAGSLTTVTAVQAVITLARKELELPMQLLQWAFQGYVALFLLIFLLGAVRVRKTIRSRTQAEREIDQTKKGIIEFCPLDQWPKPEG
jgi:cytochrome c biogenesis protein CcdA